MADPFDPYHRWLGISPEDRPPTHYQLLGIPAFENDPEVIQSAADRQMAHVRRHQVGKNSAQSQQLMTELSAAKLCLLNGNRKAEYDARLRSRFVATTPASAIGAPMPPPLAPPIPPPLTAAAAEPRHLPRESPLPLFSAAGPSVKQRTSVSGTRNRRRRNRLGWIFVVVALAALLAIAATVGIVSRSAFGTLVIELDPVEWNAVQLQIDARPVTWPQDGEPTFRLAPGKHSLRITSDVYETVDQSFEVASRQRHDVHVKLTPILNLVGRWRGVIQIDEAAMAARLDERGANPIERELTRQFSQAFRAGTLDATFHEDQSYELQLKLGFLSSQDRGRWSVSARSASQMIVEFNGTRGLSELRTLRFLDRDTFTTDLPGEAAGLGEFLCQRVD